MDYLLRVSWGIIKKTLWKILWHRFGFLRMLVLKIFGADVCLDSMAFGSTNIFRPWDFKMGNKVSLGADVTIYNLGRIEIGSNTIISQDAYLCGGSHDYTFSTLPLLRKRILIGDNVWICAGAFIGPGVTIGEGAVVGARSVVFKDVPAWSVIAGNPAEKIKDRVLKRG
jgi:putative colanic acid biosynthesis acetyltransferase WcaF